MAEFLLPPYIYPSTETVEKIDSGTSVFMPQFGAGPDQRQQYAEPRIQVKQSFRSLRGEDLANMMAFVENCKGRFNTVRALVGYSNRGSFSSTELLSNSTFSNGTTGWVSSNANLVLSATERVLRGTRAAVAADYTIQATAITTVASAFYVARVMAEQGRGAMDYRLRLATAAGNADIATTADITTGGLQTLTGTASGTSTHFNILDGINGRNIGDYQEFSYTSVMRCARVNGSSQTGNALIIDGLPTSTAGLLLRGDSFEINGELKKLTASLNSDSSGNGYLQFGPALVRTPADNDPVILQKPLCKFLLSEARWSNRFGVYADLDITLDQVYE